METKTIKKETVYGPQRIKCARVSVLRHISSRSTCAAVTRACVSIKTITVLTGGVNDSASTSVYASLLGCDSLVLTGFLVDLYVCIRAENMRKSSRAVASQLVCQSLLHS